jgi:hypothetical protein
MKVKSYYSGFYEVSGNNVLLAFITTDDAQIYFKNFLMIECLSEDGNNLVELRETLLRDGLTEAKGSYGSAYLKPEDFKIVSPCMIEAVERPKNIHNKPVQCSLLEKEVQRIWG